MGRNLRKEKQRSKQLKTQKQEPMNQQSIPTPAPSQSAVGKDPQRQRWTLGDWVGLAGGVLALLSLIVAWLSHSEAVESRKIAEKAQALAQQTYDRSAGKVPAKLAVTGFSPERVVVPDIYREAKNGELDVVLTGTEDLKKFNPRLFVKNTGDEPIDAIRIEGKVRLVGAALKEENLKREFASQVSWWHDRIDSREIQLGRKLSPGETASIPLVKSLASQLGHLQLKTPSPVDHVGIFEFHCSGRLVSANAFDPASGGTGISIRVVWIPTGFTQEACRALIDSDNAAVEITKAPAKPSP